MKPLLLVLETASSVSAVALVGEAGPIFERMRVGAPDEGERLVGQALEALSQQGLTMEAVTGVVIPAGPGSFTGLRVAAALGKGLALGQGVALYAVPTLLSIAAGVGCTGQPVCPVLDGRRGQVYAALYRFSEPDLASWETLESPQAVPPGRPLQWLGDGGVLLGEGVGVLREAGLLPRPGLQVLPPALGFPRPGLGGLLALARPEAFRVEDLARWEPNYLRPPDATPPLRKDREVS